MGEECRHPIRVGDMCGYCGADMEHKKEELFTVLHNNTNILLNKTEAKRVNEEMYDSITKKKRLVLLLDLDQTVIHTSISSRFGSLYKRLQECYSGVDTEKDKEPASIREKKTGKRKMGKVEEPEDLEYEKKKEKAVLEVNTIKIEGYSYYVKERDNLRWFLHEVSKYYEIHIYTMGNKAYASAIVELLDKNKKIFGNRIVTRDDNFGCFDKDIKRLFPTNSKHVVILDDRPDVWGFVDNLYPIRPYYFFQSEDINSPEALQRNGGNMLKEEEAVGVLDRKESAGEIIKKLDRDCISSYFDNELERVLLGLIDVHKEFFEKKQNAAEILRKKKEIFADCVAYIVSPVREYTKYVASLFQHYGGVRCRKPKNAYITHFIVGGNTKIKFTRVPGVKYVSVDWMHESIFMLARQKEDSFLLKSVEELDSSEKNEDMLCLVEEDALSLDDSDFYIDDDESDSMVFSSNDSLYKQILEDD